MADTTTYEDHTDLPTYDDIYYAEVGDVDARRAAIFERMGVPEEMRADLMRLRVFKIVAVLDDSGSMNSPDGEGGITRWEELESYASPIIELATTLDEDGITMRFLNRGVFQNVRHPIDDVFAEAPKRNHLTPLGGALQTTFAEAQTKENPTLVVVFTDGCPSDVSAEEFRRIIQSRDGSKVFVSFVACTGNADDVAYLDGIDVADCTLDVIDDYKSERKQVTKAQGVGFIYTKVIHACRILLGPVFPKYDKMDEVKL